MSETTRERRARLTEAMLSALAGTWRHQDELGLIEDPVHRINVLRGGCESFLAGDFDAMGDGLSLGLAFLSLAREAFILNGYDVVVARRREEGAEPS